MTRQQAQCEATQTQARLWERLWADLQVSAGVDEMSLPLTKIPAADESADELIAAFATCTEEIASLTQTIAALNGRQAQLQTSIKLRC